MSEAGGSKGSPARLLKQPNKPAVNKIVCKSLIRL